MAKLKGGEGVKHEIGLAMMCIGFFYIFLFDLLHLFDFIIPDFILENNEGDLELALNVKNLPELRVSKTYSTMLQT